MSFKRLLCVAVASVMAASGFAMSLPVVSAAYSDAENTLSIDFDPNDGVITYGTVDSVGACKENDTNNVEFDYCEYMSFPSDYIWAKDENGTRLFAGSENAGADYDYTDMLEYAILQEVNSDSTEIRIEPGVYYFGGTIKVWGGFTLNGVYGQTVFVCEKNDDTALFKAGTNQTYYSGGSITDIAFVVKDANDKFKTTSSAQTIMDNILNPKTEAFDNYHAFQGMNISWFTISNCSFSGFYAPFSGLKGHMCSRICNNTVGPTKVVFNGTHFIDCYIYNNYFYGGILKKDGHYELPLFTTGLGANLTVFNNNYLENYYFDNHATVDNGALSYSNCTFDHVYNIEFYNPNVTGVAVTNCLFRDNTYSDLASMFESFGLVAYSAQNKGENTYVIRRSSYTNQPESTFNKMSDYNYSRIIVLWHGVTLTQCRFEEKDMTDTILFTFNSGKIENRQKNYVNIQIADNSYKIDSFKKDEIFDDGINIRDNGQSADWGKKYYLSKQTSKEACIFYDPVANQRIDLSCFFDPDNNETLGYAAFGKVGADEASLISVYRQYYNDIKNGRNIVYLSDFGATPDDMRSDSTYIQKAFDTIAKTGDILCVDGTYNITTPILLRGGKTYRVVSGGGKTDQNYNLVGGGFSIDINNSEARQCGGFVQSCNDNEAIGGYFINVNYSPGNIGSVDKENGSIFYQVNFKDFTFSGYRMSYFNAAFEECTFDRVIIEKGLAQYNYHGFMKRCIFKNSVIRNEYTTGSCADYGAGVAYAYMFYDTDLVNSTFRGNWVEFTQFTNGFRLNYEGNSLFVGNEFDYCWNFQYGKNDISSGNVYTHCSTQNISTHLQNISGIAPDKITKEIKNGWLEIFHISDGIRIVGENLTSSQTMYTTFFMFDGRANQGVIDGKTVTSISDVRMVANLVPLGGAEKEIAHFEYADNVLLQNCQNNNIDLTSLSKSKLYIKDDAVFTYDYDKVKSLAIPGATAYLWSDEQVHYFGSDKLPLAVTKKPVAPLVQNLIYDLEDTSESDKTYLTYTLDFNGDKNVKIIDAQGNDISPLNTLSSSELINNVSWKAYYTGSELLNANAHVVLASQTPHNKSSLYSETSYISTEPNANKSASVLSPNFISAFDEYENKVITAQGSFYGIMNDDMPVVIYGSDDENYYGIQPSLQNYTALRYNKVIIPKSADEGYFGSHPSNRVQIAYETMKATSTDISAIGNSKPGSAATIYYDGTDIAVPGTSRIIYDPQNLNTSVVGVEYSCYYDYYLEKVSVVFTFDFSKSFSAGENGMAVTKRFVTTGEHDISGIDSVAGICYLNDAWTDYITFSADTTLDRETTRGNLIINEYNESCTHDFTTYIRKYPTCTSQGFDSHICSRCKIQLDYTDVAQIPHSSDEFEYSKTEHWQICDTCKTEFGRKSHISSGEATNDTAEVCTECGYIIHPAFKDIVNGDVNCDKKVNLQDVVMLYQSVSRWNVLIFEQSADVTGDGKINIADVVLLYQYVSKWNVTLK